MRTIHVEYHHELGGWWAESPEIAGFTAADPDLTELRHLVLDGLRFHLGDEDLDVVDVTPWGGPLVTISDQRGLSQSPFHNAALWGNHHFTLLASGHREAVPQ